MRNPEAGPRRCRDAGDPHVDEQVAAEQMRSPRPSPSRPTREAGEGRGGQDRLDRRQLLLARARSRSTSATRSPGRNDGPPPTPRRPRTAASTPASSTAARAARRPSAPRARSLLLHRPRHRRSRAPIGSAPRAVAAAVGGGSRRRSVIRDQRGRRRRLLGRRRLQHAACRRHGFAAIVLAPSGWRCWAAVGATAPAQRATSARLLAPASDAASPRRSAPFSSWSTGRARTPAFASRTVIGAEPCQPRWAG